MQILVFICFVGAPEDPATDGGQDDAAPALMNMSSPPCRRSRERVIKTHTHGKFVCSGCQLLSRTPPPPAHHFLLHYKQYAKECNQC